jgi:hypothetical protein
MRKSSWIVLALCVVLAAFLGLIYVETRSEPEALTQEQANQMLHKMQAAVDHKDVNGIMAYVAPDSETHIANLNQDQLRLMLARAFRDSGQLHADVSHVAFQSVANAATIEYDLHVTNRVPGGVGMDYAGHITLHLRRVEVPRLFGLFHAHEWRMVGGETTGPDPASFGD